MENMENENEMENNENNREENGNDKAKSKNRNNTVKKGRISKLAQCIRKTSNTLKLSRYAMPDSVSFDPKAISPTMSAKYTRLIQHIQELDAADMRKYGTRFKHFLFTDIRESAFGAKAIASFLKVAGFELRMGLLEKRMKRGGKEVVTKTGDTVYIEKPSVAGGCNGFAMLQSLPLWKNPLSVATKKKILTAFNSRPENSHGELLRIILLDSKFKEGIDLFDVKYVHLLEPAIAVSDLKQAVGRATRYCGQKGLPFTPRSGWPLQVFIYNTVLPRRAPFLLHDTEKSVGSHELMIEKSGLDIALLNVTQEITILAIQTAVDYELNYRINNFNIEEALLEESGAVEIGEKPLFPKRSPTDFDRKFRKYEWTNPKVQNGCEALVEKGKAVVFSKTQDFVRHYFTPEHPLKGLLAWHSVGTGKTCMAVAAATTRFEQAGYTILWVTRNALMSDVYKNVFDTVCSIPLMDRSGTFPKELKKQKRLLSKAWLPPVSYRTFQNAMEQKNELGRLLYKRNAADPLRKVFLVIDEIHKLQDGTLSAAEAADFKTIQNFLFRSYEISGKDSVRPLIMTATPIADSPNELFEILNTLIPDADNRFPPLDEFRTRFTSGEGNITKEGRIFFEERAKGLISYLNREFDPSTFAQPKFQTISIPLLDPSLHDIDAFIDEYMKSVGLNSLIAEDIKERDCDEELNERLVLLDGQITEVETQIAEAGRDGKAALRSRIQDIKQLMKDEKLKHATRRKKCVEINKKLAKAETQTRKAARDALIKSMKEQYDALPKEGVSDQLAALEKCFGFKNEKRKKVSDEEFAAVAARKLGE